MVSGTCLASIAWAGAVGEGAHGVGRSFGPLGWFAAVVTVSQFWQSLLHAGLLGIADAHSDGDPYPHAWPWRLSSPRHRLLGSELPPVLSSNPSPVLCPGSPSPSGQVTSLALGWTRIMISRPVACWWSAWKRAGPCETQGYKLWLGRSSSPSCCARMLTICFPSGICTWLQFITEPKGDPGSWESLSFVANPVNCSR